MGGPTFQEYDYMYYGSASYGPGHDDTNSNHNSNNKGYNSNYDNYQDSNDYSIDSGLVDYPDTDYHKSSAHNYVDYQGSSQSGYNNNQNEDGYNYQEETLYVDTVEYPVDSGLVTMDYPFEDGSEDYSDTNYPEHSSNNDVDYPSSNDDYSYDDSVEEYQDRDYDHSTSNSYGYYQSTSSDTNYDYGVQVRSLSFVMLCRLTCC